MKNHSQLPSTTSPRLLVLLLTGTLLLANAARAANQVVMNTADAGAGSLRQAISDVGSGDTITFDPAVFDVPNPPAITLGGSQLTIDKALSIDASALSGGLTIDANGSSRVIHITASGVTLDSLTLTGGDAGGTSFPDDAGGAILVESPDGLIVRNCHLTGNSARFGGAITINNTAALTTPPLFANCSIAENTATGTASARGGAAYIVNPSTEFANCTIAGNTATSGSAPNTTGGGIHLSSGSLTINQCTLRGNSSGGSGGGIYNDGNPLTLSNSIVAQNTATNSGPDLHQPSGSVALTGVNFIGDTAGAGVIPGTLGTDYLTGDPLLAPLGDYGGPTFTMPPRPDSPAINAAGTTDPGGTDQRGPGFPRFVDGALDIGAVEYDPTPVTAVVQNNLDDTTSFGTLRATLGWVPPGSTITFAQTLDGSTIALNGTRLPTITRNVTIDATALSGGLTLDAQDASQIMSTNGAPSVSLHGLTLTGGNSSLDGGAIENNGATLALTHCTLFGNTAQFGGGAIVSTSPGASLALTHCTLTGNTATGSSSAGGAINATGTLTLRHCTLSGNTAGGLGGGVVFAGDPGDTFTLENSIVAGNTAPNGADINNGTILVRTGANVVQGMRNSASGTDSGLAAINADPLLAPLADYGGPTFTIPPLPGSPAIDAAIGSTETFDQRGFPRSSGIAPDIGAVELQHLLVTTAADEDNGNNDPAIGTGTSLREAIDHNSPARAEIITFAQTLNGGTITLGGTQLLIDKDVTIDASALSGGLTLSGNSNGDNTLDPGESRIFDIPTGKIVTLRRLNLINGITDPSSVTNDSRGGAIRSEGQLTVEQCSISGCRAKIGGGLSILDGSAALIQTTLSGNVATGPGGGIHIKSQLTLALTHCTLSGNEGTDGGGIDNFFGLVTLTHSIVAGNTPGADIFNQGTVTRTGANIVQDFINAFGGSDSGPAASTADPLLAPLGDYGGPTFTMPPLPGSPAIDAAPGSPEPTDQRGFLRPVDGDGDTTAIADIGAAEFTPASDLAAFFGLDTDGDGNLFGLEFALGTDPNVSDAGNPRNLRLLPQAGGPMKLTFGRNQTAQPFMIWRLTRSTTLLPGSFDEIFRYDGPTSTATNTGTNSTINPTSFEITDPTPPIGKAFYRFEAELAP